jgi:cytochrome oxidase assembly protein ShyY1
VLRVLATRRWLGALALAAVFATAAFFLGRWQWHRYEDRSAHAQRITAHYDAAPTPISRVVGAEPLPTTREWTKVTARGRYAAGEPLLVRNRPLRGTYGYEVLAPLDLESGTTLLVNRGWVPNAETAQARPEVPPSPTGDVTVTGWVRPSERSLDRDLPAGQLASVNLTEAAQQVRGSLLGAYLVLDEERTDDGSSPERPARLERPDTDLGSHQAYALQWWGSMPVGFVLVYFGARREFLESRPEGTGDRPRPARPRKVRIWDEEDA